MTNAGPGPVSELMAAKLSFLSAAADSLSMVQPTVASHGVFQVDLDYRTRIFHVCEFLDK
jgi:hypothetical protein